MTKLTPRQTNQMAPTELVAKKKTLPLGNLPLPRRLGLISIFIGLPFAALLGYNAYTSYVDYQQARSSAISADVYEPLANLQEAIRLVRSRSPEEIPAENLDRIDELIGRIHDITAQSSNPNIVNLGQSIYDKMSSIVSDLRAGNIDASTNFERSTAVLTGEIPSLFTALTEQGGILSDAPIEGVELGTITGLVLPGLLPSIGNSFGAAYEPIGQARDEQNGIATDLQKYQIRQYIDEGKAKIQSFVNEYEKLFAKSPELKAALAPEVNKAAQVTDEIFDFMAQKTLDVPKITITETELNNRSDPYLAPQYAMFTASANALAKLYNDRAQQYLNIFILSVVLLVAVILLLTFLLRNIINSILRPVSELTTGARQLSNGNFAVRVPVMTNDELAVLTASFNEALGRLQENEQRVAKERLEQEQLQNNIGQFLDVTMEIAEGDLTKRGTVTEDVLGNVVDSINLMTEELAYVLTGTRDAATSVTQGSEQMLSSTETIRSSTLKTTETAQRVAEQTRMVTDQIETMARNAQASAQAARQALEASLQGQQAVQQTLGDMESIRESSQTTAQRIQELSQRSKEISNIVDTISQIASQTNLLSLHASIEAAGAGEAGERFSVVADEVRDLADQSAQAATQITSLITGIQREIAELTTAIRENTEQVNQGYAVAGTAGNSLEQIGELSRESARLAEQISLTTREQVNNIQTVNASVQEIAMTAEESQRSVDQGRAAAEQLQQLANQLTESLARFRLPKA